MKTVLFILICCFSSFSAQENIPKNRKLNSNDNKKPSTFFTDVPNHDFDILLYNPTENSVSASILSYHDAQIFFEYNNLKSPVLNISANEPFDYVFQNLSPNKSYNYFVYYKKANEKKFSKSTKYHFSTPKYPKNGFNFTVIADSHLDENCDTLIYRSNLKEIDKLNPDFHIDLGDTFMVDKYGTDYKNSIKQFLAQRYYFGLFAHSAPLFMVQGNHDGESGNNRNGMSDWSKEQRQKYFPSNYPKKYYAFNWGNALFIVLDPFENTTRDGNDNPWNRTLGTDQYLWLENTLKNSNAEFKFVFIHNLVGGLDIKGKARGGSAAALLYEWGGNNENGIDEFHKFRPNFPIPIHQLLKKYGVNIVFHGHDHVYAKEYHDGIIYQCLPQPGTKKPGNFKYAEEYGYSGNLSNFPGFLIINIANTATIEYRSLDKIIDKYNLSPQSQQTNSN